MLMDAPMAQRTAAVTEATGRVRNLWTNTPEGTLAWGTYFMLMSDLVNPALHASASRDWHFNGEHWYVEGFGVSRGYLHRKMVEWGFIAAEQPTLSLEAITALTGTADPSARKTCPKCGHTKSLTAFAANSGTYDGRQAHCKQCKSRMQKERLAREVGGQK